jgi:hypothetical protein
MQKQMEQKTTLRWQLQDLLHAAGEDGITQSDYDDHDGDVMQARIEPVEPSQSGKVQTTLDLQAKEGLPQCMTPNELKYIWLAIYGAMRRQRGEPPTLQWVSPITCATQMKRSLEDRQVHPNDDRRFRTVTLRAQPYFQKRPARDNVKVLIELAPGRTKMYFAMYVPMINTKLTWTTAVTNDIFYSLQVHGVF